ncbi:winged helix-turn-helix domain-containing protein [Lysobacter sp. CFH 32150]|uniref:winged helix-turn-helix domain-containing protein n=1 Tax=Lysobacter sp. CFH 32150 TaxID=2927128 RepID=UPI001FA7636F|nr:winged helix-turn-helix domain-containing protein [Lysobacter sp. CFH 32150]MCI4568242.1 winged helix-turn-helix domain-containing protein [Lysobacter sp. CFH 32150]
MRTLPWPVDSRYLQTGDLLVDLCYRRTTCGNVEVELPQRVFDLLLLLMAEPHTLHTRTELFARLWPDVIVEDANLSQSMWLLRKALGEERKQWIRTVAKGGYVFEPPGPVEWFMEPPAPSNALPRAEGMAPGAGASEASESKAAFSDAVATDSGLPATESKKTGTHRRAGRTRASAWAAIAMVTAGIAIFLAIWYRGDRAEIAVAPPPPLAVALIEVEDRASSMRWPVKLLREWLGWKLGSLPEVTLLTEADLAADDGALSPRMILLTSGSAPDDPSQVWLRARFQDKGREQRIELQGSVAQVPAMVDKLSRQLMEQLVPQRAKPWPPLLVDAPAARRYADAVDAIDRRDWMTAAAICNEVVRQAPRFGLARLELAYAQSQLAQATSAVEQMEAARKLMQPAPAEVTELMRTRGLAMDPQRLPEAAEAFGRLAARYPNKTTYALEHADLLTQTGELQQALKILSAPSWGRKRMAIRIAHLLSLSDVYNMLGDPERMRRTAQAAERMARDAGAGWELERGYALLQIAKADSAQYQERADTKQYEAAAKLFEAAGNHTAALYTRFLAEHTSPPDGDSNARMEALLTQARKGGYRRVETVILQQSAMQHYAAGDLVTYRRRMEEAMVAARDSRDVLMIKYLSLPLLQEDIEGARFSIADERVQQLRRMQLQGEAKMNLDYLDATLDAIRGRYRHSVATMDRAELELAKLQSGPTASEQQVLPACSRAEPRLQLGDLAGARTDWKRCAASGAPYPQFVAMVGRAYTELLAGDRAAAEDLLRQGQAAAPALGSTTSEWSASMVIAALLTRFGDISESDRLYNKVLPSLRAVEYDWAAANVETGLAENAAARGDWIASQQHSANARRDVPADAWYLINRLEILDIATALASGNRQRAVSLASKTHATAQRLGDRLTQIQLHSLLPGEALADDCNQAHRDRMLASSGMRGATLDWLHLKSTQGMAPQVANAKVR